MLLNLVNLKSKYQNWTFWSFQIQSYHCRQDKSSQWHKVLNLFKIVYTVENQVKLHILCKEMYSKPPKLHSSYNIFLLIQISEEAQGVKKQSIEESGICSHQVSLKRFSILPFLYVTVEIYLVFHAASLLPILWDTCVWQLCELSFYFYRSDIYSAKLDVIRFIMPQYAYSEDCNSCYWLKWTRKPVCLEAKAFWFSLPLSF